MLLCGQGHSESEMYCQQHAEISQCEMTTHELPDLVSSWCGMVTSGGLYLYTAVGIWNEPQAIYGRLFLSLLLILRRDVHQTEQAMKKGLYHSGFWFWKAFLGAFALAKADEEDTSSTIRSDRQLQVLRLYFNSAIRRWSNTVGIVEWRKAKDVLGSIVWPTNFQGESLAEEVWEDAFLKLQHMPATCASGVSTLLHQCR